MIQIELVGARRVLVGRVPRFIKHLQGLDVLGRGAPWAAVGCGSPVDGMC